MWHLVIFFQLPHVHIAWVKIYLIPLIFWLNGYFFKILMSFLIIAIIVSIIHVCNYMIKCSMQHILFNYVAMWLQVVIDVLYDYELKHGCNHGKHILMLCNFSMTSSLIIGLTNWCIICQQLLSTIKRTRSWFLINTIASLLVLHTYTIFTCIIVNEIQGKMKVFKGLLCHR
jgi:hypothetical protein